MAPRFKLPPGGDVPPVSAARRMGLSLDAFREALPELVSRGFPQADETTGNFDLDAIDAWRRARHPHHFSDRLDLCENPPKSCMTTTDAGEAIRQKIVAALTPSRDP
jgi:hypothetical protein